MPTIDATGQKTAEMRARPDGGVVTQRTANPDALTTELPKLATLRGLKRHAVPPIIAISANFPAFAATPDPATEIALNKLVALPIAFITLVVIAYGIGAIWTHYGNRILCALLRHDWRDDASDIVTADITGPAQIEVQQQCARCLERRVVVRGQ